MYMHSKVDVMSSLV